MALDRCGHGRAHALQSPCRGAGIAGLGGRGLLPGHGPLSRRAVPVCLVRQRRRGAIRLPDHERLRPTVRRRQEPSDAISAARRLRAARRESRHAVPGARSPPRRPADGGSGEDRRAFPAGRQPERRAALVQPDESHGWRRRPRQCRDRRLLGEGGRRQYPAEYHHLRLSDLRAVRRAERARPGGRRPDAPRAIFRALSARIPPGERRPVQGAARPARRDAGGQGRA